VKTIVNMMTKKGEARTAAMLGWEWNLYYQTWHS